MLTPLDRAYREVAGRPLTPSWLPVAGMRSVHSHGYGDSMNSALMFSKASDEWSTPQETFDALHAEFRFGLDAAATRENSKCGENYYGPDRELPSLRDSLAIAWPRHTCAIWLNPPYSQCRVFIEKAARHVQQGPTVCPVVCLVPSRTDTRWWHEHVWDRESHLPWPGVEIRFIKGRLKFRGAKCGAPFPSVVIIFRGSR